MAVGRIYTVSFAGVSVSAAQDLIAIYAGSSKAFLLHSVTLGQITATAVGNLQVSVKRLTASVTPGSGGSAATPQLKNPGDAAATVTARINDTTPATGAAAQVLLSDAFNVVNGFLHLPPEDDRLVFAPSTACVISLITAPGSAEVMSGTAVIEEMY